MNKKLLILALCITFLTHLSYINSGFVWLDHNDIEEGHAVLPMKNLSRAFFIPFGQTSFYRPLVTIVNSVDSAIYGKRSSGFHLTNLVLHLLVVLISVQFLKLFFKLNDWQLFLGALIVGVHPAGILIVGEVIQRQESLLLLFLMLSVIFHAISQREKSFKNELLAGITFTMALFTKETAIVILPLLILFWEFLKGPAFQARKAGPYIISLLAYISLRLYAVPGFWGAKSPDLSISEWLGTRISLLDKFIFQLFSPLMPNLSDAQKITNITNPQIVLTLLFIILAIYLIIKKSIKPDISRALILLAILILPGLSIIPVPRVASPHYLYLPVVALSALFIVIPKSASWRIEGSLANTKFFNILFSLWLIISSYSVFTSGPLFKNDLSLFAPEVKKDPDFLEAYYFLGKYYLNTGKLDLAEIEFSKGLKDTPGYLVFNNRSVIAVNLGAIKYQKGNLTDAEKLFDFALKDAPSGLTPYILYNQALIARKYGNYQKIISLLSDVNWTRPEALILLSESYHNLGLISEEIETLNKVKTRFPDFTLLHRSYP